MRELRFAWRSLRASRLVTTMALLTLILAIGANTAIFSLVNGLLLRSLPVRNPNRLVMLYAGDSTEHMWSYAVWNEIDEQARNFDGAAAWSAAPLNLASRGQREPVSGLWVSGGFFKILGVPAALGRMLAPSDDRRGGGADGPVVVLSYAFWQRQFGGVRSVIGTTVDIGNVPFTVIGITPRAFLGPEVGRSFDVAAPIGTEPLVRGERTALDRRAQSWLNIFIRLRPGQTAQQASASIRAAQPAIRMATVPTGVELSRYLREPFALRAAANGSSIVRQRYQQPLLVVFGLVILVLLIASANIATLLLARTSAKRHEFSLQRALGASRLRLVKQSLFESALLAGLGAVGGIWAAPFAGQLVIRQMSTLKNAINLDVSLDWHVLTFTVLVTFVAALLFGSAPALVAARAYPGAALHEGNAHATSGRRSYLLGGLVVAQIALSLMLMAAAGLFVQTFANLAERDLGFDPHQVLIAQVDSIDKTLRPDDRLRLYDRLLDVAGAVPGVARAGISLVTPVSGSTWRVAVRINDSPAASERDERAFVNAVTPGWFATIGTRLLHGRDFTDRDVLNSPHVAVVNEEFVRRFVATGNAVGRTVTEVAGRQPRLPRTIVGVVENSVYRSLREAPVPIMYVPLAQNEDPLFVNAGANMTIRSSLANPAMLTKSLRNALLRAYPELTLTTWSLSSEVDLSLGRERLLALLAGFFGGLSVLLAAVGLFGLTAYAVTQRRKEIGIRMALGADAAAVAWLVLRRATGLVIVGVFIGAALTLWMSNFVEALVYGLTAYDPETLLGAIVLLASVTLAAVSLPVYWATRIDPIISLRTF